MRIISTVGPKVFSMPQIDKLISSGTDTLRFNFSHVKENTIDLMKEAKLKHPEVLIFQDLQGNKLRVSSLFQSDVEIFQNQLVYICGEENYRPYRDGSIVIPLSFSGDFNGCVISASKFSLKDGSVEFEILEKYSDNYILTKCTKRCIVRKEKGFNAFGMARGSNPLNLKDKRDLIDGLNAEVDIVCLSFVTSKEEILEAKKIINTYCKFKNLKKPLLYAKIECMEGIKNLKEIVKNCDGIMIGRGDLSAEVDYFSIPMLQEQIIKQAKRSGKDIIIGTFVLETMRKNSRPSVSEMNDIFNFIKSGITGFMLSSEVSTGDSPYLAISSLRSMLDLYCTKLNRGKLPQAKGSENL